MIPIILIMEIVVPVMAKSATIPIIIIGMAMAITIGSLKDSNWATITATTRSRAISITMSMVDAISWKSVNSPVTDHSEPGRDVTFSVK